jgi:hypothetical protein
LHVNENEHAVASFEQKLAAIRKLDILVKALRCCNAAHVSRMFWHGAVGLLTGVTPIARVSSALSNKRSEFTSVDSLRRLEHRMH